MCFYSLKKKKAAFILHPCLFTTKLPVLHTDFDTEITSWIKMASTQRSTILCMLVFTN